MAGRSIVSERDALNNAITYTYDASNNRINVTDALTQTTGGTAYTYDANGDQTGRGADTFTASAPRPLPTPTTVTACG